MKIFNETTYKGYAFWLGDGINKIFNISTREELTKKIYKQLDQKIKEKIGDYKPTLAEITQLFLDTATGSQSNLSTLLISDLTLNDNQKIKPYSYLSDISDIDTVITIGYSKILESIWKGGEIHDIFNEKPLIESDINLFKIFGDFTHSKKVVLTSQNIRRLRRLKLYDHFWNKLKKVLTNKNLVLLGVSLDGDSKNIIDLALSKTDSSPTSRFFVTSDSLSLEDETWLIKHKFKFIYENDKDFIRKLYAHINDVEIKDEITRNDKKNTNKGISGNSQNIYSNENNKRSNNHIKNKKNRLKRHI